MGKTIETCLADFLNDIALKINFFLWNQNSCGAHSQSNVHRKISGIAAHYLYNRTTLVGLHRVAKLINALNSGVCRGIETDAIMRAADIVVNRTGNANHIDTIFAQRASSSECSVTANGNDAVQSKEFAG